MSCSASWLRRRGTRTRSCSDLADTSRRCRRHDEHTTPLSGVPLSPAVRAFLRARGRGRRDPGRPARARGLPGSSVRIAEPEVLTRCRPVLPASARTVPPCSRRWPDDRQPMPSPPCDRGLFVGWVTVKTNGRNLGSTLSLSGRGPAPVLVRSSALDPPALRRELTRWPAGSSRLRRRSGSPNCQRADCRWYVDPLGVGGRTYRVDRASRPSPRHRPHAQSRTCVVIADTSSRSRSFVCARTSAR